jgi:hypothetical protein
MNWRKIVDAFKRLDDRLSDAVYLHGCYLTGQEKIVRSHRQGERNDHSHADPPGPTVEAHKGRGFLNLDGCLVPPSQSNQIQWSFTRIF